MNIKPRAGVRRTLDAEWKAFRAEAARQKAEWDEEQKTKKFIQWYRAGVEELSTTESDNRMAIDTAIENYPKLKDNTVLSQQRSN